MDKPMPPAFKLGEIEDERYFYDKRGRDRIIMSWLRKNKPAYTTMYRTLLSKRLSNGYFNDLLLSIFESGVAFGKISKQTKRSV